MFLEVLLIAGGVAMFTTGLANGAMMAEGRELRRWNQYYMCVMTVICGVLVIEQGANLL